MFEVEKPRQFHYVPRFYDPEKEKWEALKKKYAIEEETKKRDAEQQTTQEEEGDEKDELAYFQQRVRDINREQLAHSSRLTWRDMFRKREMPQFHYQPRFSSTPTPQSTDSTEDENRSQSLSEKYWQAQRQIKIRRRFDISDSEYMKPISTTKIMMYGFIAFLLIMIIIYL